MEVSFPIVHFCRIKMNKMEELILLELKKIRQAVLMSFKEYLTLQEVSMYTGFSVDHIHKLTSLRKVTHSKPGEKVCFVKREDLLSYLKQNRIEAISDVQKECLKRLIK